MADEVTWQRKVAKRITEEGGYGKKWSSAYLVGVPDLLLSTDELGMFANEVKLEKKWVLNTSRTLKLTDKQALELQRISEAGGRTGVMLVVEQSMYDAYINVFPRPRLKDKLTMTKHEALAGAYNWQSKERLIPWLNRRMKMIDRLKTS